MATGTQTLETTVACCQGLRRHESYRSSNLSRISRFRRRAAVDPQLNVSRLSAAAAADAGRFAAGKPHILLQGEIYDGNANEVVMKLLVLAERKPPQGHPLLHQFARRQRDGHDGDLRHDADSVLPRGHLLRRPGRQRRRGAVGRRHQGQALRPAARQGDDPPAVRPGRRPGFGHRNSGRRDS